MNKVSLFLGVSLVLLASCGKDTVGRAKPSAVTPEKISVMPRTFENCRPLFDNNVYGDYKSAADMVEKEDKGNAIVLVKNLYLFPGENCSGNGVKSEYKSKQEFEKIGAPKK